MHSRVVVVVLHEVGWGCGLIAGGISWSDGPQLQ